MTPLPRIATARSRTLKVGRLVLLAVGAGLVLAVNLYLAGRSIRLVLDGAAAADWTQYAEAGRRLTGGELYAVTSTYAYHYSPYLAYLFSLLAPLGVFGWRLLHVAGALALPSWPMRLLALAAWPFWYDVEAGNLVIFVVLAAAWALRGSRVATAAYLLMVVLIPRPLMLPVAAWLLWKRPEWRLPFVSLVLVHTAAIFATGWAAPWLNALLAAGGDIAIPSNVGPSRFIGPMWALIGLPLAAWLTWKGRLGLASLAASVYWLPYYLLVLLLEAAPHGPIRRRTP